MYKCNDVELIPYTEQMIVHGIKSNQSTVVTAELRQINSHRKDQSQVCEIARVNKKLQI